MRLPEMGDYSATEIFAKNKDAFEQEQYQANLTVTQVIAIFFVAAGFSLIFLTNWGDLNHIFNHADRGTLYRNYLYLIAFVVQLLFLAIVRLKLLVSPPEPTKTWNWLMFIDIMFALCWAAAMSSVDQLIHGDIAVYIVASFAAATSTRFRPKQYYWLYGVSLAIFIMGVTRFQSDHARLVAHYINGTCLVILAVALTVVLYRIRVKEFLNRKTVERQKAEMEERVRERTADLARANEELRAEIAERKAAVDRMMYLSHHDPLTGLYNRTFFEEEMRRLEEEGVSPVGLIMSDVDGLKLINDSMGHDKGDSLLITTANLIKSRFPASAVVARVGGDEFAVLLPHTSRESLEDAYNRLQQGADKVNHTSIGLPLSLSIGVAMRSNPSESLVEVFKEADNNMYKEKLYRSRSTRSAIVQTLMKALEARDFITEGHAERLQDLVGDLGVAVGLPSRSIVDLRLLAQFHDIGKVGLPDRILFKPGPLTPEERLEMQRHSEIGHRIALSSHDLMHIADWILKHHEWWNGEGYPLGLKGKEIPLECRILAVADAYDAMTSDRPYRKAMPHEEAIAELRRFAGIQFDPYLVEKFAEISQGKATSQKIG